MEHHFRVEEAEKYGIEKAVLLYNLRFWLEKNRANEYNIHEKDEKSYYWTYNSSKAFNTLFPYIPERSISRYLSELADEGVIILGNFNQKSYDKTRWYTMPEFETSRQIGVNVGQNGESICQNGEPIPDIKPDSKQEDETPKTEFVPFSSPDSEESIQDISYEETDEDGNPLVKKKKKAMPRNKQALVVMDIFSDLCFEYTRVRPVKDTKGYMLSLNALQHLTPSQIIDLFEEWFASGLPNEELIQITRALSHNQINSFKARNIT